MDVEISPEEVNALAGSGLTLLDVREPWEFELSSIPGSRHIPMNDIPARVHSELRVEEYIVVVCHHGVRSLTVTHWLRRQGFSRSQSMRGGIDAWSRSIDASIPIY